MFKIYDGRERFYQWDLDRKLIVEDASVTEVHFCNRTGDCSLVCETYVEDGVTLVNVPNILLQTDWKIHVYAYDGKHTKHDECYEVKSRTKPADYIYTETEVISVERIVEDTLEKAMNGIIEEASEAAIEEAETIVEGALQQVNTQLDKKADKKDTYTKTEVDNKFGGVYRVCGTTTTFTLPGSTAVKLGDVYNLSVSGESNEWNRNNIVVNSFQNLNIPVAEVYVNDKEMYVYDERAVQLLSNYPTSPEREDWESNRLIIVESNNFDVNTTSNIMLDAYVAGIFDNCVVIKWVNDNYYWDGDKESYFDEMQISVIEWEFQVADGDNVVWTDGGWDKLAASVDTSNFVTKEDLGDIETALDEIIEIQNSLLEVSE